MSQNQAKVEFDFDAQPASGELTIKSGEVVTVLKEGIDGGWIEVRNSKGKVGLVPASYVSKMLLSKSSVNPFLRVVLGAELEFELYLVLGYII
uniref:SH3 domain-containing protein n=2 Tax=Meloidogyne incognita group TaxID=654580 RepID=A0A915LU72_MELJA